MSTKEEMAEIDQMEAGSNQPSMGKYRMGAANVLFLLIVVQTLLLLS
jgi:hypothetical protein